ncbi:MAG: response regulator [Actinomycetota bacterium]|nr:response regulator [Actinomycetota bacterium]
MANVLVVEDDADIRSLVALRLRSAGHRVITAGDATEALSMVAERGAPDVAVLDVGLPGTDGFGVLEQLRATPGAAALPAVFLSARVQDADIERGRAMGAYYLTKPFVASALINTVARCVPQADSW